MAEEKKSSAPKTESKPAAAAPAPAPKASSDTPSEAKPKSDSAKPTKPAAGQNGKGDGPRNCFSPKYRSNFDSIDWSK